MAICNECGRVCGYRHPVNMFSESYLCNSCFKEHQSNQWKVIGGMIFLAISAIATGVYMNMVAAPIANACGYATAKNVSVAIAIAGVAGYIPMKSIAGRASGCLWRVFLRLAGFILYALGFGLLIAIFLLSDAFRSGLGIDDGGDAERPAAAEQSGEAAK